MVMPWYRPCITCVLGVTAFIGMNQVARSEYNQVAVSKEPLHHPSDRCEYRNKSKLSWFVVIWARCYLLEIRGESQDPVAFVLIQV